MHLSYKKCLLLNKYIGKIKLYMVIIKKKTIISLKDGYDFLIRWKSILKIKFGARHQTKQPWYLLYLVYSLNLKTIKFYEVEINYYCFQKII